MRQLHIDDQHWAGSSEPAYCDVCTCRVTCDRQSCYMEGTIPDTCGFTPVAGTAPLLAPDWRWLNRLVVWLVDRIRPAAARQY